MLYYARIFHTLQEVLLIPEDALICNFKVLPARVALHSIKNPGCLVQGLVEFVSYFLCVTCTFNRP